LDDWLNEITGAVVVEVVDQLDLSNLTRQYAGRGSKAHHPPPCWRSWCMATLRASSPAVGWSERPMIRLLSLHRRRSHPDHDTLATFRRRFLGELEGLFVQVLELAQEMKLLKLGAVCLDGTKLHANARATAHSRTGTLKSWRSSSKRKYKNC